MITDGDTVDLQDGRRVTVISSGRLQNGVYHVVLCPKGAGMDQAFQIPREQALEAVELKAWRHYPAGTPIPPVPVRFGPPPWCREPMTCKCERDECGGIKSCPCL